MFINREDELAVLEKAYGSERAELFVLYGRRRVGKTELLRRFCEGKRHVFFVADLGTDEAALSALSRQVGALLFGDAGSLAPFSSWDAALEVLGREAARERLVVVLDEFTYLISGNPGLPSMLQRLWDTTLSKTRLLLVLCGSYVGMMEQHVLGYRAPLYGRRTGQWRLTPLQIKDAARFFPHYDAKDRLRAFGVLGGVPAYLRQFDDRLSLLTNIQRELLSAGSFLYDEPRFLLLQELREPSRYFSILEALAGGRTRQNELAQAVGLPPSSMTFYLSTLRELGLVERVVPATEMQQHKSKLGLYRIADPLFRFWFRYVYPNRSRLERGQTAEVKNEVAAQLDLFVAPAFEELCREATWRMCPILPGGGFVPKSVGAWWDRNTEIDVVAIGEGRLLLGECKWASRPVGTNILEELRAKAERVAPKAKKLKVTFALFSRSGFTAALAAEKDVLKIGLPELMRALPAGPTAG